jgi:O-antigen/teichoic acid export membrane protein
VIAMLALSSVLALIPSHRVLHDPAASRGLASRSHLIGFARYGIAIVGANVVYQLIVLVNRSAAASTLDYAAAGQLSLGTDLTLRLMVAVAAALDVFLFQMAVRREALEGADAADRQLARNMLIVGAVLVLLAVGYVTQLPAFEAAVIPSEFRRDFAEVSLILVPGVLAFCLAQFAFNPVFQLSGRTSPVVLTAILAGLVDLSLLAIMPRSAGVVGFAWAHSASLLTASAVAGIWAFRIRRCFPPPRDLAVIAIAGGGAFAAIWPLRTLQPPWLALASAMTIGTAVYAAILLAFDFAGSRNLLRNLMRARPSVPGSTGLPAFLGNFRFTRS